MKSPFTLVPSKLSEDTLETLKDLIKQAQSGELIGVAFVAMYKRREYSANATGEARRNPTFTRGMLAALDDILGEKVDE